MKDLGFRHIDTAAMYENEAAVGAAIATSGAKRAELFVATKVRHDQLSPKALRHAFDISLVKLKLDYVDLYMMHWPSRDMDMAATLEALIELREGGLAWAIGVCNFNLPMIRRAVEEIGAPLAQGRAANDPTLAAIGRKHGATAAQAGVAWPLDQEGVIAIPKASRPESQKADLEALTISLDDKDRAAIATPPKDQRFVRPPFAPEWDAVA